MSFGSTIRVYRKKMGLTQEELAQQLCVTSQAVSKWESESGYPDMTQIVPLARILNISTDVLFGLDKNDYDREYAEKVKLCANELRDNKNEADGAIAAAEYLNEQCELNPFNYEILKRFVQSIAHLSRFADKNTANIFKDEPNRWKKFKTQAFNRGAQVIRYSNEQSVINEVHTAIAWIYYHEADFESGWEHIHALPSVSTNQIQEGMNSQFTFIQKGWDAWKTVVEENIRSYTRVINREIVYALECCMWNAKSGAALQLCDYAIGIMKALCKNETMKPYCQGFYRDSMKYCVGACLREGNVTDAAKLFTEMTQAMSEYAASAKRAILDENALEAFGKKGERSLRMYTADFVQSKIDFIRGQLKSWCEPTVFAEFEKLL